MNKDRDFFQEKPYQDLVEQLPYEQKQELAGLVGLAINFGLDQGINILKGVER